MSERSHTKSPIDASQPGQALGYWVVALTVAFAVLRFAGGDGSQDGSLVRQLIWSSLFGLAVLVLIRSRTDVWASAKSVGPSYWLLLTFALMTVLWSPEPGVSAKRWVQLAGVSCIGLALAATHAPAGRLIHIARPISLAMLLMSLGVGALWPSIGVSEIGWNGLSSTKNTFGQLVALVLIAWSFFRAASGKGVVLKYFALSAAVVALVLSRSATTGLAVTTALLVLGLVRLPPRLWRSSWNVPALVVLGLLLIAAYGLLLAYGPPSQATFARAFGLIGRDSNLTGRDYLWQLMLAQAEQHPWVGLGYGAFWRGLNGDSGYIAAQVKWGYPGQAHNGYIDMFNELGSVGLVLFAASLFTHLARVKRVFGIDPHTGSVHLCLAVFCIVLNVAESAWMRTTSLWWILYVLSTFEVAAVLQRYSLKESHS